MCQSKTAGRGRGVNVLVVLRGGEGEGGLTTLARPNGGSLRPGLRGGIDAPGRIFCFVKYCYSYNNSSSSSSNKIYMCKIPYIVRFCELLIEAVVSTPASCLHKLSDLK